MLISNYLKFDISLDIIISFTGVSTKLEDGSILMPNTWNSLPVDIQLFF